MIWDHKKCAHWLTVAYLDGTTLGLPTDQIAVAVYACSECGALFAPSIVDKAWRDSEEFVRKINGEVRE